MVLGAERVSVKTASLLPASPSAIVGRLRETLGSSSKMIPSAIAFWRKAPLGLRRVKANHSAREYSSVGWRVRRRNRIGYVRDDLCPERLGFQDLDATVPGPDPTVLAELAERPDDDLPHGPDGVGELLLADRREERRVALALRSEVEQVPCDPLPNGGEGAAEDLGDELDDPFAELIEECGGDRRVLGGESSSDLGTHDQHIRVDDRLERARHLVGRSEHRDRTHDLPGPDVADRERPTVRGTDEDPDEAADDELEMGTRRARVAQDGPGRDLVPDGSGEQAIEAIRGQPAQARPGDGRAEVVIELDAGPRVPHRPRLLRASIATTRNLVIRTSHAPWAPSGRGSSSFIVIRSSSLAR